MEKFSTHNILLKATLRLLPFIVLSVLLSSCYSNRSIMLKTPEDYPYAVYNDSLNTKDNYRIAVADIITINVFTNEGRQRLGISIDPIVAGTNSGGQLAQQSTSAYVVESDSTIHIPILGRLKVVGLTVRETETMFRDMFSKYYNSPYVELRVTNRRFMVFLGGNTARVIQMTNDRTTLIEAIALVGGLPALGKAYNIKLIRGTLANPTVFKIDLSTLEGAKLGGSMIIQANDIIYVEPTKRNFDIALQQSLSYISTFLGLISVVTTIVILTGK